MKGDNCIKESKYKLGNEKAIKKIKEKRKNRLTNGICSCIKITVTREWRNW